MAGLDSSRATSTVDQVFPCKQAKGQSAPRKGIWNGVLQLITISQQTLKNTTAETPKQVFTAFALGKLPPDSHSETITCLAGLIAAWLQHVIRIPTCSKPHVLLCPKLHLLKPYSYVCCRMMPCTVVLPKDLLALDSGYLVPNGSQERRGKSVLVPAPSQQWGLGSKKMDPEKLGLFQPDMVCAQNHVSAVLDGRILWGSQRDG